jgi:hypothetical protein
VLDLRAAIHHHGEVASVGDPRRLEVHDPELQPQAPRAGGDRLFRVRDAELRPAKHVDDVDRPF